MTISPLNSFSPTSYKKPLHFGLMASVDIGSSDGMTAKTAFFTDKGEELSQAERNREPVSVATPNSEAALHNLAVVIKNRLQELQAPEDDKVLKRMFFFIPDRPQADGRVPVIHNIRMDGKQPLSDFRLDRMPEQLISMQLPEDAIPVAADCNVVAVNDMGGGTLATCSELRKKHPELFKPGMKLLYLMSGGGLGAAKANFVQVKATSGQPERNDVQLMLTQLGISPWYEDKKGMHDYEIEAAAKPALVNNFVGKLPYWKRRSTPSNPGKTMSGKVVTTYDEAKTVYNTLRQSQYQKAARYAVDRYIDAIAMLTARSLYEGTNVLVLAGGVAGGVKKFVDDDHSDFLAKDQQVFQQNDLNGLLQGFRYSTFDKILAGRIWSKLNQKGKDEYRNNHFKIVTDIEVQNNTMGAPYLAKAQQTSTNDLWIVPAEAFNPFA